MKFNKRAFHLHFVGIGGIGMSGIAEVFYNQGYTVSGSDLSESDTTRRLSSLGLRISYVHRSENVHGAHVVVISSAVSQSNPEVVEAKKLRIPVIPRAEMLGELMRGKIGIAIAGTHGKTTTTSMLATILSHGGLDPTLIIGGKVDSFGGNAKLGQGEFVVAEADESDGSFLHLPATFAVITNIDNDHLDHFGNLEAVDQAFIDFVAKLPFYGAVAVCLDDLGVQRCLARFGKPFRTYGTSEGADFRAVQVVLDGMGSQFELEVAGLKVGKIELRVPGHHNVLNALASIAMAEQLQVPFQVTQEALNNFKGVKRRFETHYKNESTQQWIVEDYGHHPTEIQATLAAARGAWLNRKLKVLFQPHRYSRTLHSWDGFLSCFNQADQVYVMDIYPAGESPIEGVHSQALVAALNQSTGLNNKFVYVKGGLDTVASRVGGEMQSGDLLMCMGAGSITRLPDLIQAELEKKKV